jgi:membrane-associated phospholipid phosphatase
MMRVLCLIVAASSLATAAHADVVTDWNTAALNAIRGAKTTPPAASRALAILHLSIYDAVNGIDRSRAPYLVPSTVPRSASIDAAAAAAGHEVMVTLFPSYAARFDAVLAATLDAIPDRPQTRSGIDWGTFVARQVLNSRSADNSDAVVPLPSLTGVGAWKPTPPAFIPYLQPQWAFVTPFAMDESAQFRPFGPPPIASDRYARDYNEVKALGAALGSTRTAEQTMIAEFWADGSGTETPPGHWNTIAQGVAQLRGNTVAQNARLFALLNVAMADAGIAAWDAKYFYDWWRPVTAIHNGDSDGNPATAGDSRWTPLLVTPPFPEYISGHSTFSGAASVVLAGFFGTDNIAFATGSDFLPGVFRQFSSFSAAAREAAVSRLYGGIHYRSSNEDGLAVGRAIGEWTLGHFLVAKGNQSR